MPDYEFLGPYRLGNLIGRGGMGSVYAAVHDKTGQQVALKLLSSAVADEMKFRRRFAGEIETLKRLRHPGIVQLFGYGEEQGALFYAMELVEGESVQRWIRREKRIDWLPTLDVAIQVTAALKHAHDFGVIHRDLKPANLLITPEGKVKLVDFGIAKIFGYGEQTVIGSVMGTADYMAPEQAGSGPITPRTDLYSLGSVMYSMLTGRPPFSGKQLTEVLESVRRDRPVPLDLINPELPAEVVAIVQDLLEKDPQERPPTALAVVNRLRATRAGLLRDRTLDLNASQTVDVVQPEDDGALSGEHSSKHGAATSVVGEGATDVHKKTQSSAVVDRDEPSDKPNSSAVMQAVPAENATLVSADVAGQAERDASAAESEPNDKPTHFQEIDPQARAANDFSTGHPHGTTSLKQIASVIGLLVLLGCGIAVIVYGLRKPSADQLHRQIVKSIAAEEVGDAERDIRQFLSLYPDDERAEQIAAMEESIQDEAFWRRLRGKMDRTGGANKLDPAELSFFEAMQLREQAAQDAREHLRAWLAVYVPPGADLDNDLDRMARLATRTIADLESTPPSESTDPRLQRILAQIDWGQQNLSPSDYRKLLAGIETLYAEHPWATEAVQRAREEQQTIRSDIDE